MTRAQRLLAIIDILRERRNAVTAHVLSERLGISLRSVYRDILSLRESGAEIEGEPGLGYTIRAGTFLPPLMFTQTEAEALAFGLRWVANGPDAELARSAQSARTKLIDRITDSAIRARFDRTELMAPNLRTTDFPVDLSELRRTVLRERKIILTYSDKEGLTTTRKVWPIVIGYFPQSIVLVGWCELRGAFRNFRVDRILAVDLTDETFTERVFTLQKRWRKTENISA